MNNKTIRYPRQTAVAETTRKKQHKEIGELTGIDKVFMPLEGARIQAITKVYFELSGAFPYIFDALAFVCTHHQELVELGDDPNSLYYRITLSIEDLTDFALDGYDEQRYSFLKSLVELSANPKGKIIPISKIRSVSTVPLVVSILRGQNENLPISRIKQLANIGAPLPIAGTQILFFKPLFFDLLQGRYGENWFPLPKAFQAKLMHTLKTNTDNPDLKKLRVKGMPSTYRRYFLYLNRKDNSKGNKLVLDSIDLWESINPGEVKEINGVKYLRRWKKARTWLHKANMIFNIMARNGLLDGAKIAPAGVWYEPPLKKYTVHVKRSKHFEELLPLEDHSAHKELKHFKEKNESPEEF